MVLHLPNLSYIHLPDLSRIRLPDLSQYKLPNLSRFALPDLSQIQSLNLGHFHAPHFTDMHWHWHGLEFLRGESATVCVAILGFLVWLGILFLTGYSYLFF